MAGADRSGILYPLTIPVGDDFADSWTVTETVGGVTSAYDLTGATITAQLYVGDTLQPTAFTTSGIGSLLSISLTDTQTTTIGAGSGFRWVLRITKNGITQTVYAGPANFLSAQDAARRSATSTATTLSLVTTTGSTLALTATGLTTAAVAAMIAAQAVTDAASFAPRPAVDGSATQVLRIASLAPLVTEWATVSGGGGSSSTAVVKTANYTLTSGDTTVIGNTTSGGFTLTLPTAVGATNVYTLKKGAAANTLTVGTTSAQTIDGSATIAITRQYEAVTVVSDGANWNVI